MCQNVLREYHPLPNVDETLAQLAGAKKFSKLNANSEFSDDTPVFIRNGGSSNVIPGRIVTRDPPITLA